jgi:hypothetical protein
MRNATPVPRTPSGTIASAAIPTTEPATASSTLRRCRQQCRSRRASQPAAGWFEAGAGDVAVTLARLTIVGQASQHPGDRATAGSSHAGSHEVTPDRTALPAGSRSLGGWPYPRIEALPEGDRMGRPQGRLGDGRVAPHRPPEPIEDG